MRNRMLVLTLQLQCHSRNHLIGALYEPSRHSQQAQAQTNSGLLCKMLSRWKLLLKAYMTCFSANTLNHCPKKPFGQQSCHSLSSHSTSLPHSHVRLKEKYMHQNNCWTNQKKIGSRESRLQFGKNYVVNSRDST